MLGWSNVNGASLAASSQCKGEILKDFDQVGSVHRAPYRLEMPVWKKGFAKNRQNRSPNFCTLITQSPDHLRAGEIINQLRHVLTGLTGLL